MGYYKANRQIEGGMTMKHFVLVISFLAIFIFWKTPMATAQFSEAGVEKLRVAVEAPDFTLKEVGGGKVSLKELRGKIILLNFFATW
jgi:cytochrome oxidase Cu insertion factor (SCO1/SenC/PrrC family)